MAELPSKATNPRSSTAGRLGKTHLLNAVGHQSVRLFPGMTVVYLSSSASQRAHQRHRYDRTGEFRARYRTHRSADDATFSSSRARSARRRVLHTFNDLYESRKQIIVSATPRRRHPRRSRSGCARVSSGASSPISSRRNFETRGPSQEEGGPGRVKLPTTSPISFASRVKSNIASLRLADANDRVLRAHWQGQTVDLAKEVLSDLWGEGRRRSSPSINPREVCDFFGIKLSISKRRPHEGGRVPSADRNVFVAPAHPRSRSEVGRASAARTIPPSSTPSTRSRICSRRSQVARSWTDLSRDHALIPDSSASSTPLSPPPRRRKGRPRAASAHPPGPHRSITVKTTKSSFFF